MGFLFSGVFWGILLVIFGVSVIINVVFHVHIPVMRILFGLILLYLGLQVLTGNRWGPCRTGNACFKSEALFEGTGENRYSVVFGKNTIDLTAIPADAKDRSFKVRTVFGASVVTIPSDVPVIIKASSAFGGMNFPNGTALSFGEYVYKNKAYADQPEAIKVEIDLVFGGCTITEK